MLNIRTLKDCNGAMGKGKRGTNMLRFVELKAKDYECKSSSQKYSS